MSGNVSAGSKRPTKAMDWGVGSSSYSADFIEPDTNKKKNGWFLGERPPYQIMNWLFNNAWTWIKNLDQRTPRQPLVHWVVDDYADAADRDFQTLAEAMASSLVESGHTILVRSQESLSAAVVIGKSVNIIFDQNSYFYGVGWEPEVYIKLSAANIKISGGRFYGFAVCAFYLDGYADNCIIENCLVTKFDWVDDQAVSPGYRASYSGIRYLNPS